MIRRGVRSDVRRGLAALACAAALAGAASRPAHAYVRYRHPTTQAPFYWKEACVYLTAYPGDFTDMTAGEVMTAASAAAATWSSPAQNGATSLTVAVVASTSRPGPRTTYDGQNRLVFRHDNWCNTADGSTDCLTPAQAYDPAALAITSVFAKPDGHIVDADIEVNAKYFTWTDAALDLGTNGVMKQDLQNTLTHELGHFIGLDHTCSMQDPTDPLSMPALDNGGNPVPDCAGAPSEVQATTMFPSATPYETDKRTLEADDLLALHEVYPAPAAGAQVCPATPPGDDSGCRVAGGASEAAASPSSSAPAVAATLLAAAAILLARRRSIG